MSKYIFKFQRKTSKIKKEAFEQSDGFLDTLIFFISLPFNRKNLELSSAISLVFGFGALYAISTSVYWFRFSFSNASHSGTSYTFID